MLDKGISPQEAGARNRAAILSLLRQFPGITQAEIARSFGFSRATTGRHIRAIRAEWTDRLRKTRGWK